MPKKHNVSAKPTREGVYHEEALLVKLQDLTGGIDPESDEHWLDTLVVTSDKPLQCDDPEDDLKRELAFYNQALEAVNIAHSRFERLHVPYMRPDDYFAEMVKSDKQMTKVKRKMLQEQGDLQAAEDRRKQSANKKFGKQVQRETLVARAQQKKREINEVAQLRKKRKGGSAGDFDVDVDYAALEQSRGQKRGRDAAFGGGKGGGKGGQTKAEWKQQRFGKKGRTDKRNTAESSFDISRGGGGRGGGGKGKGRGGGKGKGGGRGGGSKPRPGKERRKRM